MATMSALSAKVAVASVAELKGSRARAAVPVRKAVTASAESKEVVSRRAAMGAFAVSLGVVAAKPAFAAYGDAANVFGSATTKSGEISKFVGDGYKTGIPAKFYPSKEREFPGMNIRYEDTMFPVNYMAVLVNPGKNSITEYGTPESYLASLQPLLGVQSWVGDTDSEGGFKSGKVSVANVLTVGQTVKAGKTYYEYEILTRTADGDEGGRHHLISVAADKGKLYTFIGQAGDKRWFKGLDRELKEASAAFIVGV